MSQETSANSVVKTFKASAAISPGYCVKISAAGTVTQASAGNTGAGIYVGEQACVADDHVPICIMGVCRAWIATAVTAGDLVADNTSGRIHTEATDDLHCMGVALETSASGTKFIEVLISPFKNHHA
jgi:hypothetical protein